MAAEDASVLVTTIDDATVVASQEEGTLVGGNVLTPRPVQVWRTTDLPSPTLTIDAGSAKSFNTIALLNGNFGAADTWTFTAAGSEGGLAAPPFSTGPILGRSPGIDPAGLVGFHSRAVLSAIEVYRWYRLTFNVVAPVLPPSYVGADFFDLGRLLLCTRFTSVNCVQDWTWDKGEYAGASRPAFGGQDAGRAGLQARGAETTYSYTTPAERDEADAIARKAESTHVLFSPDITVDKDFQYFMSYGPATSEIQNGPRGTETLALSLKIRGVPMS